MKQQGPTLRFILLHNQLIDIPTTNAQTIDDIKRAIEKRTNIDRQNVKLIRNNVVLNANGSTQIQKLNLQPSDKLRILTCKPISLSAPSEDLRSKVSQQSSKEGSVLSGSTKENSKQTPQFKEVSADNQSRKSSKSDSKDMNVKDLTQELLKKGCKEALKFAKIANGKRDVALLLWKKGPNRASPTYLSHSAITQILNQLIRSSVFQEKKLKIMANPQLWSFIIQKIVEGNSYLTQIIKKYPSILAEVRKTFYQIEPPLSNQQQQSTKLRIQKRLNHELVSQLRNKMKNSRENIETAVAIGENNAQKAIEILIYGYQKYIIVLEEPLKENEQPFFIAKWLMNLTKIKKMKLAMNVKYLEEYTLSLMYLCSPIADILIRNWNYAEKVLQICKESQLHLTLP